MAQVSASDVVSLINNNWNKVEDIVDEFDLESNYSELMEAVWYAPDESYFRKLESQMDAIYDDMTSITVSDLMDSGLPWRPDGVSGESYGAQASGWDNANAWLAGGGLGQAGVSLAIAYLGDLAKNAEATGNPVSEFGIEMPSRDDFDSDREWEDADMEFDEEVTSIVFDYVNELYSSATIWFNVMNGFLDSLD